ncbi:translocation/assembly module TamB domain-containing protein [Deinococcus lacus]|uniref:translocation/assembly module TamB domain-containing protein n=1 Tax=Deinococcus lacus TaxID=392561 RepID=UPI0036D402F1
MSGRLNDPRLFAQVRLGGGGRSGLLYAQAQNLDWKGQQASVQVYGQLSQGGQQAKLNLAGQWPQLGGTVQATLAGRPVTLTGQQGVFRLDAGAAGGGSLRIDRAEGGWPLLSASADLDLLRLAPQGQTQGQARLGLTLSGPLNRLTVSGDLAATEARWNGVSLSDLAGTFGGTLHGGGLDNLSGTFKQGGRDAARLQGGKLAVAGLRLGAFGSELLVQGEGEASDGAANLSVAARGTVDGSVQLRYTAQTLTAAGDVQAQGFGARLDLSGSEAAGWRGVVRVTGGPQGVLTGPLRLNLAGPWQSPVLSGTGELLGAPATLTASRGGAALSLSNGAETQGSGSVQLRPGAQGQWEWQGSAEISSPDIWLKLTPSGPLARPVAGVVLRRGRWQAAGAVSSSSAQLSLTDGVRPGHLNWQGSSWDLDLGGADGFDLGLLDVPGLSGNLKAGGQVAGRQGALNFAVQQLSSPYTVPYLDLPLSGDVSGTLTFDGQPRVQAAARLEEGELRLEAVQRAASPGQPSHWEGHLTGSLRRLPPAAPAAVGPVAAAPLTPGQLDLDLTADAGGLSGQVRAERFPMRVMEQAALLSGTLDLGGQTFTLNAAATGAGGQVSLRGGGGLADAVPALQGLAAVAPTSSGYDLQAVLTEAEVSKLLGRKLSGRLSGEVNVSDGAGTFVLRSDSLEANGTPLPARVEGTQIGNDWRIRGYLGDSDFFAGLSQGILSGRADIQALPLGDVMAGVLGASPGEGAVTGVARFRAPLADPLSGSATVVAERIRVDIRDQGQPRTLTGTGTLDYADRELRAINIQMAGAGTWDVQGRYTRQDVNLRADFSGTTFTPLLNLVPALAGTAPRLDGSLSLGVSGSYEQPRGTLRATDLSGEVAGTALKVPALGVTLEGGVYNVAGTFQASGGLAADGSLRGQGNLSLAGLRSSRLTYTGWVAPSSVGTLPAVTATLSQDTAGWTLSASSLSQNAVTGAGRLQAEGRLSPRLDLRVQAQNYDLPLRAIYARESALNADVRVTEQGERYRVSGSADFARLLLGRPDAPAPAAALAGQKGTAAEEPFVSPLPEVYTTFPARPGEVVSEPGLPFLERVDFADLPLRFSGGIRLNESLARADLTGSLTLSGTGAEPRLKGALDVQRGQLYLRDNEFTVRSGRIQFAGETVYPGFELVADGTVRSSSSGQRVPITLTARGDFQGENSTLVMTTVLSCTRSGPECQDPATGAPYTDAQLTALVLSGVPDIDSLPANLGTLGASALQTALNVYVLGELQRNLADAFGLDVFRITPDLLGGDVGAAITLGSYVTDGLYLQYRVDLRGEGLVDATYTTPDGRITFKASTPITGLDLESIRPSVSAAYNLSPRTSVTIGMETTEKSSRISVGVKYRFTRRP